VTSMFRLYYSIKLQHTKDVTYYVAYLGVCSICEITAGIICCCLPVMPKLFQTIGPKFSIFTRSGSSKPSWSKSPSSMRTPWKNSPTKHSADSVNTEDTWGDLYSPQDMLDAPYKNLKSHELKSAKRSGIMGDSDEELSFALDLPKAVNIRIQRTIDVNSLPIQQVGFDVEKQQQILPPVW